MKKLIRVAVLMAVAPFAISTFAADEVPAYWQVASTTWGEFAEPANWKIGDPDSGAAGVPSSANYIWITSVKADRKPMMFDMGGGTYTVGGMSTLNTDADNSSANGQAMVLSVTNGTLNLQGHVCGALSFTLWNGATVRHSGDHRRAWAGGDGLIKVHEGARFEDLGRVVFLKCRVVVDAGGTYVLNPSAFGVYYKNSNIDNGFTNRGRFEAPNGIHVTYKTDESGRKYGCTTFRNEGDGAFLLGGNVESVTQSSQTNNYEFVGGTLEASNDVAFVGFRDMDRLFFDNAVEVKVDVGSSLSLNGFTYGENAALTKTGPGKLVLGGAAIPSLTVAAGSVELNEGAAVPTTTSFASGTTLILNAPAIDLNPTAYAGMAITVDSGLIVAGATLIQSDNAAFLAYARDAVNGGLLGDLGAVVYGNALIIAKAGAHMFDASGSSDLTDASAWGGILPTAEDDVIISGGVANYPAGSTKFKSILLQLGATLAVSGGTDESPVDLPPIELDLDAKLLISDVAQMTNVFTTVGDADTLPVLEIATNATLIAQSPEHPEVRCSHDNNSYKGPDYGFRLKNVLLNWYGTIKMAEKDLGDIETAGAAYRHARLTLGYAAADETSYIGVDCRGGRYLGAAEGNTAGRCLSALVVATPDKGGTVIPVGTLLFRDYTREDQRPSVSSNTGFSHPGIFIGKCNDRYTGNPASVVYDVVFEGETDISVKGNCSIAGGAHVCLKGPASWTYKRTASNDENLIRCVKLYDEATLTVEDGAFLDICTTEHATYRGLQATGTAEGQRVFTARDAKISLLNWSGSGNGCALIDNSLLEIGYLRSSNTLGLIDAVFDGLASVEISNRFTIAAADVDRGNPNKAAVTSIENWNRFVKVGPPLTGTGSLAVSNELADAHAVYSMTVLVTNGANTATGSAQVMPTATGAPAKLLFADGANWAGTVVADANVGLTNLVDGAAAATANFGAINGTMPIRVWKTGGVITANDKVNLTSAAGGFEMVAMDEKLQAGDVVELGLYPENAALPIATRHRKYSSVPSATPGFVILKSTEIRPGFAITFR